MTIFASATVPGSTALMEVETCGLRLPRPGDHPAFCASDWQYPGDPSVGHQGPVRLVEVMSSEQEPHRFMVQAERFDETPAEVGEARVYVNIDFRGWVLTAEQARHLACALQLSADEVQS